MPAFAGPTSKASGIHPILWCGSAGSRGAETGGQARATTRLRLRGCGFRPPAPPGGGTSRHLAGAVVAEIGGLRASARVRKGHAQGSALSLAHFRTTIVTNEHCLASQLVLPGEIVGRSILTNSRSDYPEVIRAPRNALASPKFRESWLSRSSAFAPECATTGKPKRVRSPELLSGRVPPTTLSSIMHSE